MTKEKFYDFKKLFIAILGIFAFYGIQTIYQLLFYDILKQNNFIINNIIFIGMELVLMIFFGILNYKKLKENYNDFNTNYKEYLKIAFKYWLIGLAIMYFSNLIINYFITNNIASNEINDRLILKTYPIFAILAMNITGPFIEELTFRGNFKEFTNNNILFVIITSFAFAFAHILTDFSSIIDLVYLIPYGSLSLAFGITYVKTNNIYTSIIMHSIHNTLSVILLVLLSLEGVL